MDSAIHFVISMWQLKGNVGQKKKREEKAVQTGQWLILTE